MNRKVQLKEQEMVGQEVVLSDIYPKTDTTSVEDPTTGTSLNIVLDHLVEMINNKLTRIVNSVNNRSGAVVLDANDVGLGNVDNVSFEDIKDWVIDTVETYFEHKRLYLFANAQALENVVRRNDPMNDGRPFLVETWDEDAGEYRTAIGYMTYDTADAELYYQKKFINDVKQCDSTLAYDKGLMKVHISHHEDNLLSVSPYPDGGLAVWNYNTGHDLAYYNSFYQPKQITASGAVIGFLAADDNDDTALDGLYIYINGKRIINHVNRNQKDINLQTRFKFNAESTCNGHTLVMIENPGNVLQTHPDAFTDVSITPELMLQQTLMGHVERVANNQYGTNYEMHVYTTSPFVTWGLQNQQTFQANGTILDTRDTSATMVTTTGDYSGINVLAHVNQYEISHANENGIYDTIKPEESMNKIVSPEGVKALYADTTGRQGGMFIPTDMSLCVMPYAQYGLAPDVVTLTSSNWKSNAIENWFAKTPYHLTETELETHSGYLNAPNFIGINLLQGLTDKEKETNGRVYATPLSGLRVMDATKFDWHTFGLYEEVDGNRFTGAWRQSDFSIVPHLKPDDLTSTGGLMVNVGKGLEIVSDEFSTAEQYEEAGKINVRLGKGTTFDEYARVTIDNGHGLVIDDDGKLAVDDTVVDSTPLMQGIALTGLNQNDQLMTHKLNPLALNWETYCECWNPVELGDGLRLQYTIDDVLHVIKYEMTMYQVECFMNGSYLLQNGVTYNPGSDVHYEMTWREYVDNKRITIAETFKLNELLTTVMETITGIRHDKTKCYAKETVLRSVSLNRLLLDEVKSGTDENNAKDMTIDELLNNYADRHGIPIGEHCQTVWKPTNGEETTDTIKTEEYSKTLPSIFHNLTTQQSTMLNTFFNVMRATKQALVNRNLWFTTDMFKTGTGLTITLDQTDYTIEHRDSCRYLSLLLMALGYSQSDLKSRFISKALLEDLEHSHIKNLDGTDSTDFTYITNTDQIQFMDLLVTTGDIALAIGKTTSDGILLGVNFNNNEAIHDTICDVERILSGEVTNVDYLGHQLGYKAGDVKLIIRYVKNA